MNNLIKIKDVSSKYDITARTLRYYKAMRLGGFFSLWDKVALFLKEHLDMVQYYKYLAGK